MGMAVMKPTAWQLREMKRQRVYSRRVSEGKMKQADADREIEVMRAILADYEKAAALEISVRDGRK